jgi:glyoxylase-like metal-dependent hydrolase (beta-lactamase superfamily II)
MGLMAAKLHTYVTNDPFYMENGYTVYLVGGGPCWIIDPGLPPQAELIVKHVRRESLQPAAIVLTHAHPDHIAGIDEVREELGAMPVYLAREEWNFLTDPRANMSALVGQELRTRVADPIDLPHGATLELDGTAWNVLDVSGHSPGGRALYCAEHKVVIVGDALFAGSIGRTDFPSSNGPQLMRNIRMNLMSLPDDTRVLSGHGPETTIGRERRTNPFVLHGV